MKAFLINQGLKAPHGKRVAKLWADEREYYYEVRVKNKLAEIRFFTSEGSRKPIKTLWRRVKAQYTIDQHDKRGRFWIVRV